MKQTIDENRPDASRDLEGREAPMVIGARALWHLIKGIVTILR
jgi:hypothetical protein